MNDSNGPARASLADIAQDAAGLAGAGLITYGAHLVFIPAGYVTAGLFLLAGAWLAARRGE